MKVLYTNDVGKELLDTVMSSDIVIEVVSEHDTKDASLVYYHVYKNKVTGVEGKFHKNEVGNLLIEALVSFPGTKY